MPAHTEAIEDEPFDSRISDTTLTVYGKTFSDGQIDPLGSPENPMSFDELIRKFRKCATYGEKPLAHQRIDAVVDMVRNLESMGDVRDIVKMLV